MSERTWTFTLDGLDSLCSWAGNFSTPDEIADYADRYCVSQFPPPPPSLPPPVLEWERRP
jgi:hypothetical protein